MSNIPTATERADALQFLINAGAHNMTRAERRELLAACRRALANRNRNQPQTERGKYHD